MKFLQKIVSEILAKHSDLSSSGIVLPGKRPIIFIKKILAEKKYSGFLPDFFTTEELIREISGLQEIKGAALWLFAYEVYASIFTDEDFAGFIKWFPTLLKDWDDILKFSENETAVLQNMLDEERIKNWGGQLGEEDSARRRNLDFWRKMNLYLPVLKQKLLEKNLGTSGMIHEAAIRHIPDFVNDTDKHWYFCGFNAFTPAEEKLVRALLQNGKADCYFQADEYYLNDDRQEAGKFLREHRKWKEFNDFRPFKWIENDFRKSKNISVFEVSGNISQTKVLPQIFDEIQDGNLSDTAVVLLDENLLPASLDALSNAQSVNITMGFPLKNLAFSNAMKKLFYIQKQQEKKSGSFYYNDVLAVLESLPVNSDDAAVIKNFSKAIQERNIVYLSKEKMRDLLGELSFFDLFGKPDSVRDFLSQIIDFCERTKWEVSDDILFENISHFEKAFKTIKNQISDFRFEIKMETLEILVNQIINSETIDFEGEPLEGLQIMGLLETRLLNFKNIILLSVNEGKLPLGNSQNTYLPFDIRQAHGLHTFLENDSIYAYHFYRLLQDSENVFLLFNSLTSGVNTGEKSRFITQIEMESGHEIQEIVIENESHPISAEPMIFEKTDAVLAQLEKWKLRVSASQLTSYIYNPVQFYLNYILEARESDEIEEELSQRNYGNIVHFALQFLYEKLIGKILKESDLENLIQQTDEAIDFAIERLNHQPEFYKRGMNFIHKSIAKRVVESVIRYDLNLVKEGSALEIIGIEQRIENLPFIIDEKTEVRFNGYIDRIDRLDGEIRVIDYKTAKGKDLHLKFKDLDDALLLNDKYRQALQLCIYLYYMSSTAQFSGKNVSAGIWSFAEVSGGVKELTFENGTLETAMNSIKNLILEILNPEIPFTEKVKQVYNY